MAFDLLNLFNKKGLLTNPGDKAEVRVTQTRRKVGIYKSGDDSFKYSITEYPNGTRVETKTTKQGKN